MTDLKKWLAECKQKLKKARTARARPQRLTFEQVELRWVLLHTDFPKALQMLEGMVGKLSKWLEHIKNYDPYGPKSVDRYGSGAAGIEKAGVEKNLKEILDRIDQIAKE